MLLQNNELYFFKVGRTKKLVKAQLLEDQKSKERLFTVYIPIYTVTIFHHVMYYLFKTNLT